MMKKILTAIYPPQKRSRMNGRPKGEMTEKDVGGRPKASIP
jgi:hypothetical protein